MALWKFSNLNKYGNIRSRIIYRPDGEAFSINPKGFGPFIGVSRFKYESRSYFQPSLVQVKGKKYMVPDWKEVLPETTINDIKKSDPKPNSKKGQTKLPNVVIEPIEIEIEEEIPENIIVIAPEPGELLEIANT